MSDVRHVKQEEYYEVTVRMTPEEYKIISTNAAWGGGGGIATYLKNAGLGHTRRGC
jgi:hypothetical protein